jgi:hypothetical protein
VRVAAHPNHGLLAPSRVEPELPLPARVKELWRIWAAKHPTAAASVTSSYGDTTS